MACRAMLFFCFAIVVVIVTCSEGRTKKVVIHVPYKVKKIKHTHTVYKTVHHHHTHHDHVEHPSVPVEDHDHFHHLHLHDDLSQHAHTPTVLGLHGSSTPLHSTSPLLAQHSQPVPGLSIPEFLPDVPDIPLDIDIPHDIPPSRHNIPNYLRN